MKRGILAAGLIVMCTVAFLAGRWSVDATRRPLHGFVAHAATSASGLSRPNPSSNHVSPRFGEIPPTISQTPGNLAEDDARERAFEAWAETDPAAAIEFARRQLHGDRRGQAMSAVLAVWGRKDPAAAWNWVSVNMPDATYHYDTLLEAMGRTSTATAIEYASKYATAHPAATAEVYLAALLGVTYRGDFQGARAVAENGTLSAEVRGMLVNFVAGQWGRFSPTAAATWAMGLPDETQRRQALVGLGESWSDVDPAGAAVFAAGLPDNGTRTLALRQAISKWVASDPDAARAWVVQTDRHEDFDQAVAAIATDPNLVNRDPARALRWAETIFDDQQRAQNISAILFNLYPVDPAAATRYLEAAPDFNPAQKAELLGRMRTSHARG